ncbi:MAG: TolC family protein [Anaeromyxobacteraceae bacterium]
MTPIRATLVALLLVVALPSAPLAGDGVRIEDAIRSAWKENPGLAAGAHQVEAAQADARAARDGHWPTVSVTAKGIASSEPVGVFGIKLNERRITSEDFDPARLNYPDPTGGFGIGAAVTIPIWMGGRILAGQNAAAAQAGAEASTQARRREEMALAVVQAYFGVQIGAQGLRYADDVLLHAREIERFVGERNAKGLALDADLARAVAFRAQAEAEQANVQQQLGSARSVLAMLTGIDPARTSLVTPVDPSPALVAPLPATGQAPEDATLQRPDVVAAHLRATAAEEGVGMSRASLLPAVFATAGVDTLSYSFSQGGFWWSAAIVARWEFGASSLGSIQAAEARSAAAASAARWQEVQASREVEEARRAVTTAAARVRAAREAVNASELARSLREARYRQGLLPLSDVLDAEAALAGARALLLRSQFETRIARAQLELALGLPVEGVQS